MSKCKTIVSVPQSIDQPIVSQTNGPIRQSTALIRISNNYGFGKSMWTSRDFFWASRHFGKRSLSRCCECKVKCSNGRGDRGSNGGLIGVDRQSDRQSG